MAACCSASRACLNIAAAALCSYFMAYLGVADGGALGGVEEEERQEERKQEEEDDYA